MSGITDNFLPGFGDPATWPTVTHHPNDPRIALERFESEVNQLIQPGEKFDPLDCERFMEAIAMEDLGEVLPALMIPAKEERHNRLGELLIEIATRYWRREAECYLLEQRLPENPS